MKIEITCKGSDPQKCIDQPLKPEIAPCHLHFKIHFLQTNLIRLVYISYLAKVTDLEDSDLKFIWNLQKHGQETKNAKCVKF